jgi:hypothetical protein
MLEVKRPGRVSSADDKKIDPADLHQVYCVLIFVLFLDPNPPNEQVNKNGIVETSDALFMQSTRVGHHLARLDTNKV